MDSPSSLELFLLAAIADGCATAFARGSSEEQRTF
jgi:hypothetical protein